MYVLIVDDDAPTRRMLVAALSDEGIPVATASSGTEALRQIAAAPPLLVLLDLWMPTLNGWRVLEHLRTQRPDIPVIVMTAAKLSAEDAESLRTQAAALLPKPFSLDHLLEHVARAGGSSLPLTTSAPPPPRASVRA